MRIVERKTEAGSARYGVARALGFTAGAFAFLLCALIIINNARLRSTDPMNNAALDRMRAEVTSSPEHQELREQIRELDLLVRRAYFAGEDFNRIGISFMLVCLAVMVISLKYAATLVKEDPYPDSADPKRDLITEAHVARRTFAGGATLLIGFLLATAIFWESPLDEQLAENQAEGTPPESPGPAVESVPDEAPVLASLPQPERKDLLRNWPSFLGASAGLADGAGPPIDWSVDGTIAWKTAIPLPGFGSPIVWNDFVFLSGGSESKREVYCLDTATGEMRWKYGVSGSSDVVPKVTGDTGYAAATMATEGNLVFAIFATGSLVALDFEGELVWSRHLGVPDNPYGHASSLVVADDVLLVQYDQRTAARFLALDLRDGKTRWEVPRDLGASWATPLVLEHDGKRQALVVAESALVSYDIGTGAELWSVECLGGAEVASTPVHADGVVFVTADYASVTAIDLATKSVVWEYDDLTPGVSTPLLVGEYLIAGLSDGGIVCLDTKTGEEVWFEFTDDGFYASPVLAGGHVYLMDRAGTLHVFEAAPEFTPVATLALEEEAICTPAFIDGAVFIRGNEHLFRIGS